MSRIIYGWFFLVLCFGFFYLVFFFFRIFARLLKQIDLRGPQLYSGAFLAFSLAKTSIMSSKFSLSSEYFGGTTYAYYFFMYVVLIQLTPVLTDFKGPTIFICYTLFFSYKNV